MPTYTLTGDLGTLVGGDFSTSDVKASLSAAGFVLAGTEARFGGVPITVDPDGTFTLAGIPESTLAAYTFTAQYRTGIPGIPLQTMVVGPFALIADTDLADVAEVDFVAGSPAALAEIQGYWLVVSDEEPAEHVMFGVPVVWINVSAPLAETPAYPDEPTWNDDAAEYTIPSGIIGIRYYNGATLLTQGNTYATAPSSSVTITAVALPGYTIPGDYEFSHSFPGTPSLLMSESFTGSSALNIYGRTVDMALGGSMPAPAWTTINPGATDFELDAYSCLSIDGSGHLVNRVGAVTEDGIPRIIATGIQDMKIELDFATLGMTAGAGTNPRFLLGTPLGVVQFEPEGSGAGGPDGSRIAMFTNGPDQRLFFTWNFTAPGVWTVTTYGGTMTVRDPDGVDHSRSGCDYDGTGFSLNRFLPSTRLNFTLNSVRCWEFV